MSDTKPRSPFSIEPVLDALGKPVVVTARDLRQTSCYLAILKVLARHRFSSIEYLAALTGFTPEQVKRCVRVLKATPNRLIKIADNQVEHHRGLLLTRLQLELTDAGIELLAQRDIHVPHREKIKFLTHQVMVDQILSSFEIGAAEHADTVRLISRAEILSSDRTPEQTRTSHAPESLRVQPGQDGTKRRMRPDGELFALQNLQTQTFRFFGGIEADTGTMKVRSDNPHFRSIQGKFNNYIYILQHGVFQERFNSQTYFVPFVTTYQHRLNEMLSLWEEMTRTTKWMRPCLPMKIHPLFDGLEKPRPTGHMLEEKWAVAGGDTLELLN
jgi:Replication-relaxation